MIETYSVMIESQIYFYLLITLCFVVFVISNVLFFICLMEIEHKKIGGFIVILLSILVLYGSQPLIRQLAKNEANKIIEKYNNTEVIQIK